MTPRTKARAARRGRLRAALGPGLLAGAADDDPSGIATYAQAGAGFGFELGWTLLLSYPLMVAIQAVSARIGCTTGHGLAGNLRRHYPLAVLRAAALLLAVANTVNIGADLGAMAQATRLLIRPLPAWSWVLIFALVCAGAQVFVSYARYTRLLKWLTLTLGAYFAVLATVHVPWGEVLRGLVWPHWSARAAFWQMVVAVFGTTISPYLLFWQASLEVEDVHIHALRQPLLRRPAQGGAQLARIQLDTLIGMGLSNLVGLAILVTTAATIARGGVHEITTAAQAAQALRPLAGEFAFVLFACGIVGTGLLAIPALAGSAAYALGEALHWRVGLARRVRQAPGFYALLAGLTLAGAALNALGLNPMRALVLAAIVNGVVAVPLMALVMRMAMSREIMGSFVIRRATAVLGWLATAVMALAALGMGVTAWRS
jgi:NRAMP (natural resistance-associated macrophage protein)-like metal ion transporter